MFVFVGARLKQQTARRIASSHVRNLGSDQKVNGPKQGQKGVIKLRILYFLYQLFYTYEIWILAVNPYSNSKSYANVAETPTSTRGYLTTQS